MSCKNCNCKDCKPKKITSKAILKNGIVYMPSLPYSNEIGKLGWRKVYETGKPLM